MSRSWVITAIVVPSALQAAQQVEDRRAGGGVQRAGRLVGQHQRGLVDQRPGDRDPLAFAAGELVRPVADAVGQADPVQRRRSASCAAPAARHAGVEQAGGDVLGGAEPVGEVELLEDEAEPRGRAARTAAGRTAW